jgi:hypothetical protein
VRGYIIIVAAILTALLIWKLWLNEEAGSQPRPVTPATAACQAKHSEKYCEVISHRKTIANRLRPAIRKHEARLGQEARSIKLSWSLLSLRRQNDWLRSELSKLRATPTPYTPVLGWAVWDRLASCESGGRWSYNGSSGFDGGLQFLPSTWSSWRDRYFPTFPALAWQATKEQQVMVAERLWRGSGFAPWPVCGAGL